MELAARSDIQFSRLFLMISPCLSGGAEADMPVGVAHVQLCGFSLPLNCAAVVGGFSF